MLGQRRKLRKIPAWGQGKAKPGFSLGGKENGKKSGEIGKNERIPVRNGEIILFSQYFLGISAILVSKTAIFEGSVN